MARENESTRRCRIQRSHDIGEFDFAVLDPIRVRANLRRGSYRCLGIERIEFDVPHVRRAKFRQNMLARLSIALGAGHAFDQQRLE